MNFRLGETLGSSNNVKRQKTGSTIQCRDQQISTNDRSFKIVYGGQHDMSYGATRTSCCDIVKFSVRKN